MITTYLPNFHRMCLVRLIGTLGELHPTGQETNDSTERICNGYGTDLKLSVLSTFKKSGCKEVT